MTRLRVGFYLTTLIGVIYTAASLFDSLTQVGIGVVVACIGVIGSGAVDYIESDRDLRTTYREQVWARRDGEM